MVERQILQVALHLWTVRAQTKADYGGCAGYHRSFATQNSSSRTPILVMQAVPHGNARDLARWLRRRRAARQSLSYRLMRPRLVEVIDISTDYPEQLLFATDQHVVQAFPAHAANVVFANRVGFLVEE